MHLGIDFSSILVDLIAFGRVRTGPRVWKSFVLSLWGERCTAGFDTPGIPKTFKKPSPKRPKIVPKSLPKWSPERSRGVSQDKLEKDPEFSPLLDPLGRVLARSWRRPGRQEIPKTDQKSIQNRCQNLSKNRCLLRSD